MFNISLEYPLFLLVCIPFFALLYVRRKKVSDGAFFSSITICTGVSFARQLLAGTPFFFVICAFVLSTLVLAKPLGEITVMKQKQEGYRGVLTVDVSGSMSSILPIAIKSATEFVEQRPEDIFAVVHFNNEVLFGKGTDFTQHRPLVYDAIGRLNKTAGGTAIGKGIVGSLTTILYDIWLVEEKGKENIPEPSYEEYETRLSSDKDREIFLEEVLQNYGLTQGAYVVLLTDTASNAGISIKHALSLAIKLRIPVYMIGVGTIEGGNLSSMFEKTGGGFFRASSGDDIDDIYKKISSLQSDIVKIVFVPEQFSYRPILALVVVIFLLSAYVVSIIFPTID